MLAAEVGMRTLLHLSSEFDSTLRRLSRRGDADLARVEPVARALLERVARDGDAALREATRELDGREPEPFCFTPAQCAEAHARLPHALREALSLAARRIRAFHEHQREVGRTFVDAEEVQLGWRIQPLERVGVYAPGGKARYPSSVLMAAIPARVAGVSSVVVCSPWPSDEVLGAAHVAGVDAVYNLGGALAVGALAYGTETVRRVDKIVGPGNLYVTAAKKLVFGRVAIDGIAGPSELLVVADDSARPEVVAADLLSQAEHDEAAYPLLVTDSEALAERVEQEVERQLALLPRRAIAEASVRQHGYTFVCASLEQACDVASELAAEHLSLNVREPSRWLPLLRHAGAIFLGEHTPEAAGDYLAGPSHVLPTGGAVRFGAPLGVYDFVSRTSLLGYTPGALAAHADAIVTLARAEGLEAHARAVLVRLKRDGDGAST